MYFSEMKRCLKLWPNLAMKDGRWFRRSRILKTEPGRFSTSNAPNNSLTPDFDLHQPNLNTQRGGYRIRPVLFSHLSQCDITAARIHNFLNSASGSPFMQTVGFTLRLPIAIFRLP